jgi:transcriptional regulator with XRE-family HTH domain
MRWEGLTIKNLAKKKNISLQKIADHIGVSRQTVNDWTKGQIPKGNHLISLCKILQAKPGDFFSMTDQNQITVPVHRTRKTAKVNEDMQQSAFELAKEYELLFRNETEPHIIPIIWIKDRKDTTAFKIATDLRQLINGNDNIPIDYDQVFKLLNALGITAVFRFFPEKVKAYAFYTNIWNHRVVFVNNSTNIIDLIFPLLHESIHAIRDEEPTENGFDKEEDDFCDHVASNIQFPTAYIEMVYTAISDLSVALQIKKLKDFCSKFSHSLYGIVTRIKSIHPGFDLNVGGADTNLKKQFPSIGEIIFSSDDPEDYINKISALSPNLLKMIVNQLDGLSYRKLGELLGLSNFIDAKVVYEELHKFKKAA